MNIFTQIGKIALGARLKQPCGSITEEAYQIYKLYDIKLQPKWFPIFYVLLQGADETITAIAE